MNRLLTLQEVQERLRISKQTLRKYINEDPDLTTIKLGKRRLVAEDALESFIKSKEQVLPGEAKG